MASIVRGIHREYNIHRAMDHARVVRLYVLNPTPYTLNPTPYTLHTTHDTLHLHLFSYASLHFALLLSRSIYPRSLSQLLCLPLSLLPSLPSAPSPSRLLSFASLLSHFCSLLTREYNIQRAIDHARVVRLYVLNPAPHTLHTTHYTLHTTHYTLHPTP